MTILENVDLYWAYHDRSTGKPFRGGRQHWAEYPDCGAVNAIQISDSFVIFISTKSYEDAEDRLSEWLKANLIEPPNHLRRQEQLRGVPAGMISALVAVLAQIRDGDGYPFSEKTEWDAVDLAKQHDLIAFDRHEYINYWKQESRYRLTEKGQRFLQNNEAPESW